MRWAWIELQRWSRQRHARCWNCHWTSTRQRKAIALNSAQWHRDYHPGHRVSVTRG